MKVLLIQSFTKSSNAIFPVGLARIASVIHEKHRVAVFDPNIETKIQDRLTERLEGFDPDVIGVSLRNIDSIDYVGRDFFYPDFIKLVKYIKKIKPNRKLVVGGSGFSLFATDIMQGNPEIDVGVFLEGEESFPELLKEIDRPKKVRGLFIRENDEIVFTGKRNLIDFKNSPAPAYKYFDMEKYVSGSGSIGIEGKRGCLLKCSYCPYPFLGGQHLRMRTARAIVDEIEFLVSNYGIRNYSFIDSVFNIPFEHSENICKEILARGLKIKWNCWSNVKGFTEEYIKLSVDAGCRAFLFSTDAFCDSSLTLLGKNYRQKDILGTVEMAKRIDNIKMYHNFFLNPPGISIKAFFQTIWFLLKAKMVLGRKMKLGKVFLFNRIRIEPHTKIQEIAIKEGLIKSGTSLLKPIYYTHPSTWYIDFFHSIYTWPMGLLIKLRGLLKFGFSRL